MVLDSRSLINDFIEEFNILAFDEKEVFTFPPTQRALLVIEATLGILLLTKTVNIVAFYNQDLLSSKANASLGMNSTQLKSSLIPLKVQ